MAGRQRNDKIYWVDGFREIGGRFGSFCMDNRAHICTGLAVIGTATTGVLSARSGARSARAIDRKEAELGRKLTPGEKAKLCGKYFIAPAVAGIAASAGAIGSDIFNTQTIARTNAALIMSEKAYEKLQQKTKEVLGEKKAQQVKDEIAKENVEEIKKQGILTKDSFENAPRAGSGTLYPFVDGYSNLPFWSNRDYIAACVKDLQAMMKDLAGKRGDEFDYYDKEIGVPYSEWLKMIGYDPKTWSSNERKHAGWNKGFDPDGAEDDPIEYYFTPIEWEVGFAVTSMVWEKDPTDMRLGRLIKSSTVGV